MTSAEKFIRFEDNGSSPTGKTRRWIVRNIRTGENCGAVKWHGAWRKYCFFPTDGFLFDSDCLVMIVDELIRANSEHRVSLTFRGGRFRAEL